MSFASDQLYNGYLRRNMPSIVSRVKAREIMIHLPCLTAHDRETIEAKRETSGNFNAMSLLLECLKRRENWPEQFIEALEACEHRTIAAEIRREYDALRGVNNNTAGLAAGPSPPAQPLPSLEVQPQAPQTSVVVAPAVQASVAPVAPVVQAPVAPVVQAPAVQAPVAPVVQAPAVQAPVAQAPVAPVVQAPAPPPEPAPELSQVAPPPSTPPPSPATPHPSANATPQPQREVNAHQEPEENSESDPQDDESPVNAVENHVSEPPQSPPVEQHEPASPTCTPSTMDRRSPSPSLTDLDMTDGSAVLQNSPVKAPVQDTAPPVGRVPPVVLEPQETSDAPSAPVVESSPQTQPTAPASTLPAGMDTSVCDEADVCLSKPGVLVSIQPQNNGDVTVPASSTVEVQQPYSGNSERLEMSCTMTSDPTPACSAAVNTPSAPPCQENGIAHNEPEEDYYESATQSLNQVVVNELHFAEEPSILNLDGQTPPPQPQIVNGETAKASPLIPPTIIIKAAENHHPPEPTSDPKTLQDWEEKPAPPAPSATTKYILTAAGVGACALLVAWRFKN